VSAPRLAATAKGKQPARAITPTEPTDVQRTEAEQLKIVLKRSRQETHISQQRGSGIDEGTGSKPGVLDVPSDDSEEELSWNSYDDKEVGEQTKEREESEGDKSDENSHVTLTPVNPDGLQESSSVSSFVTSMLNPASDVGVESIFTTASSPIVSLQTPTP
nr:hypothetical protein [Tanacetum cinerariifolium]